MNFQIYNIPYPIVTFGLESVVFCHYPESWNVECVYAIALDELRSDVYFDFTVNGLACISESVLFLR